MGLADVPGVLMRIAQFCAMRIAHCAIQVAKPRGPGMLLLFKLWQNLYNFRYMTSQVEK